MGDAHPCIVWSCREDSARRTAHGSSLGVFSLTVSRTRFHAGDPKAWHIAVESDGFDAYADCGDFVCLDEAKRYAESLATALGAWLVQENI